MTSRLDRSSALLIVIDVQERLIPVIHDAAGVIENITRLIRGATILGVPVLHTEQYPKGLGATIGPVATVLLEGSQPEPVQKMTFSAMGCEEFRSRVESTGRRQILVAGVETHVCVWQTVHDLLLAGFDVALISDAVGSRTEKNREIALARMAEEGAALSSTEMALFELTATSGTDEFRAISRLVK